VLRKNCFKKPGFTEINNSVCSKEQNISCVFLETVSFAGSQEAFQSQDRVREKVRAEQCENKDVFRAP